MQTHATLSFVEVRNTPPRPPVEIREDTDLIEDLCLALRGIGLLVHDLPDGASVVAEIEEAKAFYAELSRRGVSVTDRIQQLSLQTNWQMDVLLDDTLSYPRGIPYVRDSDGIRASFRCNLCGKAEFPIGTELRMCSDCLNRAGEALYTHIPPAGLLLYRTYNASRRCEHADAETVLVTWDDEDYWEAGHCKVCLQEEADRRAASPETSDDGAREEHF